MKKEEGVNTRGRGGGKKKTEKGWKGERKNMSGTERRKWPMGKW